MAFSITFSFLPEKILDNPVQFVALYELATSSENCNTIRNSIEQETLTALRYEKVKMNSPGDGIDIETRFANLVMRVWHILGNKKETILALRQLTQFLFETTTVKFNSSIAELHMVDRVRFIQYIGKRKEQKATMEWMQQHSDVMYEYFVLPFQTVNSNQK